MTALTFSKLLEIKKELDKLLKPNVIYIPVHPYWLKWYRHYKRYVKAYERNKK